VDVWWEVATLITDMLLGHWLEMRATSQARGALNALAALLPDTAEQVDGSETRTVPTGRLSVRDVVPTRPGARIPADAEVIEGTADVVFDKTGTLTRGAPAGTWSFTTKILAKCTC
jgi:P-type Cu2+ transporter